jgi:hypothetical protein
LRRAFDDTLMDPLLIDTANKAHMDFRPIGGEELQSIVSRIAGASPNVIAMVKQAITIKDVRQLPASQNDGAAGDKE